VAKQNKSISISVGKGANQKTANKKNEKSLGKTEHLKDGKMVKVESSKMFDAYTKKEDKGSKKKKKMPSPHDSSSSSSSDSFDYLNSGHLSSSIQTA